MRSTTRSDRALSLGVLAAAIVGLGLLAVRLGADGNGDLRNYHYYGGWALLHKAAGFDVLPAGIQTFHHPLLDSVYYVLSRWLNHWPRVFTFVWAIPQAVAVWLGFHVARAVLADLPRGRDALAVLAAIIGAGGATSLGTIGTSMSEGAGNALVCAAMLLVVRTGPDTAGRALARRFATVGALAGSAAVLKLVDAPYAAGLGAAILLWPLRAPARPRLRAFAWFAAGGIAAAAVIGGPWWWTVYRVTGNPLFPYFNAWFRSPLFPIFDFNDPRFLPQNWTEWLTYPWLWASAATTRVAEYKVRDARVLVMVLLSVLQLALCARGRWPARGFVAVVTLVSYVLWLKAFSILRYASGLETLSGVVIVGAIASLPGARTVWPRLTAAGLAAAFLLAWTVVPTWSRRPKPGPLLIGVAMPSLPPDSTVLLIGPFEAAFTAAFQPRSARYVGAYTNLRGPNLSPGLEHLIGRVVAAAPGPIWTISMPGPLEDDPARQLAAWGVRATDECRPVVSTIAPTMALCRAERIPTG